MSPFIAKKKTGQTRSPAVFMPPRLFQVQGCENPQELKIVVVQHNAVGAEDKNVNDVWLCNGCITLVWRHNVVYGPV